jgi:hypothetical protein
MNVEEFCRRHGGDARPIDEIVRGWIAQKEARQFVDAALLAGILITDLASGDGLADRVAPELHEAFANLMGGKADTRVEIEARIRALIENGEESVLGLMNKIQGQLGEDAFVQAARSIGLDAHLADSGSQEGWDVLIHDGGSSRYVQVKVYDQASAAAAHLDALKAKVDAGQIMGSGEAVERLDVAVNSEIYEQLAERAQRIGYPGNILDLGTTREAFRATLEDSFDSVRSPLAHYFGELSAAGAMPAALHGISNAFLVYKGAKDKRVAAIDTAISSGISLAALCAAHAADEALGHALMLWDMHEASLVMVEPVSGMIIVTVGMTTRALLRRLADRRVVIARLELGNEVVERQIRELEFAI